MRTVLRSIAVSLLLLVSQISIAQTIIRVAPPPPAHVGPIGRAPGPKYVWTEGYYRWTGAKYVWVAGRWVVLPRPGAVWVPAHWVRQGPGWVFVPGRWR